MRGEGAPGGPQRMEGGAAMSLAVVRRGLPLVLALGLDIALGEPPAVIHPVVWMGRLAAALERRAPRSAHARLVCGACGAGSSVGAGIRAGGLVGAGVCRPRSV